MTIKKRLLRGATTLHEKKWPFEEIKGKSLFSFPENVHVSEVIHDFGTHPSAPNNYIFCSVIPRDMQEAIETLKEREVSVAKYREYDPSVTLSESFCGDSGVISAVKVLVPFIYHEAQKVFPNPVGLPTPINSREILMCFYVASEKPLMEGINNPEKAKAIQSAKNFASVIETVVEIMHGKDTVLIEELFPVLEKFCDAFAAFIHDCRAWKKYERECDIQKARDNIRAMQIALVNTPVISQDATTLITGIAHNNRVIEYMLAMMARDENPQGPNQINLGN